MTLLDTINQHHAFIKRLTDDYSPLIVAVRQANDRQPHAAQIYDLARRQVEAWKRYVDALKVCIVSDMLETGTLSFPAGPYTCALRQGSTRAVVTDEKALRGAHPEIFIPHPPKVDTKELSRLLKFGTVPGAEFQQGEPTITITARKGGTDND